MKFKDLRTSQSSRRGAALIIVLAMIVLLSGLILAFFSRSLLQMQISSSSSNQVKVDQFTQGALQQVIGDFIAEIQDPANNTDQSPYPAPNGGRTIYIPRNPENAVPQLSGVTLADVYNPTQPTGLENLLKVSRSNVEFYPSGPNRAAAASTATPSLNGRLFTPERWNKPLLMQATSLSDLTPAGNFPTPDWILVARDGSNPTTLAAAQWTNNGASSQTVVGRYAFTVYNEGGLLDANVAGFDSTAVANFGTVTNPSQYKSSVAYADVSQIFEQGGASPSNADNLVDQLVQWRNAATLSASDPSESFFQWATYNPFGFLRPANQQLSGTQSDRQFVSRQQLIEFFDDRLNASSDNAVLDALQYLGTYSRTLNQPSFYRMQGLDSSLPNHDPGVGLIQTYNAGQTAGWNSNYGNSAATFDAVINPILASITAATAGTRLDGTPFQAQEPLLKKRFPLNRLAWVTYKGPSASLPPGDPLMVALRDEGITQDFLDRGTAQAVQDAFGLIWSGNSGGPNGVAGYWLYDNQQAHASPAGSNPINLLNNPMTPANGVDNQGREPDFFELLRATINAGALGRTLTTANVGGSSASTSYTNDIARRINNQIIQVGANIIDQFDPDNFPTRIVFADVNLQSAGRTWSFWGVEDLPYWLGATVASVVITQPDPIPNMGNMNVTQNAANPVRNVAGGTNPLSYPDQTGEGIALMIPYLWNPHDTPSSPFSDTSPLSPQELRICVSTNNQGHWSSIGSFTGTGVRMFSRDPDNGNDGVQNLAGSLVSNPTPTDGPEFETNWDDASFISQNSNTGVFDFASDNPTALYFYRNNDNPADSGHEVFRNPTPLLKLDNASNPGTSREHTGLHLENSNLIVTEGGQTADNGVVEAVTGERFAGFYMGGPYPLRFNRENYLFDPGDPSAIPPVPEDRDTATHTVFQFQTNGGWNRGFTFSLEYADPDNPGNWIIYKQIFTVYNPVIASGTGNNGMPIPSRVVPGANPVMARPLLEGLKTASTVGVRRIGIMAFDPRTMSFVSRQRNELPAWITTTESGNTLPPGLQTETMSPSNTSGGNKGVSLAKDYFYLDDGYVRDSDNVLRRPMGGFVPDITARNASTTVGLPEATIDQADEALNRPIMLNRPFRNVGELGHVFIDSPWKNIDFSSPESGWTGLLDVFCITEDITPNGLAAGKVDLNTRQAPVLTAILVNAYRDAQNDPPALVDPITEQEALGLSQALVARTNAVSSASPGQGPLIQVGDLVGRYATGADSGSANADPYSGFSLDLTLSGTPDAPSNVVQRLRESPIRALSSAGQAGTWNLMIDLVTQTGKYPVNARDLNDFTVEAERRVWLHVAIDRLTGEIIDQQIEVVSE
ncbi:MAG: hypothetical protein AAFY98_00265 [Verrucomicrobiota bacterium]